MWKCMCRTIVLCVLVGRDQNDTISCSLIFKINFKLCTYSEVGVIAL